MVPKPVPGPAGREADTVVVTHSRERNPPAAVASAQFVTLPIRSARRSNSIEQHWPGASRWAGQRVVRPAASAGGLLVRKESPSGISSVTAMPSTGRSPGFDSSKRYVTVAPALATAGPLMRTASPGADQVFEVPPLPTTSGPVSPPDPPGRMTRIPMAFVPQVGCGW